jgi:hypothetical protein
MIYNFRFDRNQTSEIVRRVREDKILSQGWGGGETRNLNVNQEEFVTQCRDFYGLASTRVPTSLTKIRRFKDGDLLVTPHLPENGKVSTHVVAGDFPSCYDYRTDDSTHLNHRIRLKESYGTDGTISIHNTRFDAWRAKLPSLRLPILDIAKFEASFRNAIEEKREKPTLIIGVSPLEEYIEKVRSDLLSMLQKKLADISNSGRPISFESVCERLLSSAGYRIVKQHKYDRAGGDIDYWCVRDRSDISRFENGQTLLFVQVKKHTGTSGVGGVEQLVNMIKKEPEADGCVMSLADDFSPEAVGLAEKEGIVLLNGKEISELLLEHLAGFKPAIGPSFDLQP